jgi:hypothetical protein
MAVSAASSTAKVDALRKKKTPIYEIGQAVRAQVKGILTWFNELRPGFLGPPMNDKTPSTMRVSPWYHEEILPIGLLLFLSVLLLFYLSSEAFLSCFPCALRTR